MKNSEYNETQEKNSTVKNKEIITQKKNKTKKNSSDIKSKHLKIHKIIKH